MTDYITYRAESGLTEEEAIRGANTAKQVSCEETLVFFTHRNFELDPSDRYDFCLARNWSREGYVRSNKIIWSSVDGYYGN